MKTLKKSAERQKQHYDTNTKLRIFSVGDWVWILHPPAYREKFGKEWLGPYLITSKWGEVNYSVQANPESRKITLHVDHMKRYKHETPLNWLKETEIGHGISTN